MIEEEMLDITTEKQMFEEWTKTCGVGGFP